MAIVNRTLDPSEQREIEQSSFGLVVTGSTLSVCLVPYNATLDAARLAVSGLSGAPAYDLRISRFIVGAGVTSINPGTTTITGVAYGTSGMQSLLLAAPGSSLVNLLANDIITVTSSGANTAATAASVAIVLRAVQDIKTNFGV